MESYADSGWIEAYNAVQIVKNIVDIVDRGNRDIATVEDVVFALKTIGRPVYGWSLSHVIGSSTDVTHRLPRSEQQ
jgi:hypothetical protein